MSYFGLTWRELDDQFWGRTFEDWKHTSAIIAMVANQNIADKNKRISVDKLHPHIQSGTQSGNGMPVTWENLHRLFEVVMTESDPWETQG